MKVIELPIEAIKPYENNPRDNSRAVEYLVKSISEFGFQVPLVVSTDNVIVCGHTRYAAAKKLKYEKLPCVVASELTDAQIKAFRIIDNKSQELALWNFAKLDEELGALNAMKFDLPKFNLEISPVVTSLLEIPAPKNREESIAEARGTSSTYSPSDEDDEDDEYSRELDEELRNDYRGAQECTCPACGHKFIVGMENE